MIRDLSESIRTLVMFELAELIEGLSVSFEQPDDIFSANSAEKPALNFFLYDIREDLERRQPNCIRCSYMITAWSAENEQGVFDEHWMLSCAIRTLCRYSEIPKQLLDNNGDQVPILQGDLANATQLPRAFTMQNGEDYFNELGEEFWQAMRGIPKPKINYSVSMAADIFDN